MNVKSDKKIILDNIYFTFYIDGENYTNVHLDSKPKEIQEIYCTTEILSNEKKLEFVDQVIEYFYNFWKLIETTGDTKQYYLYFNINLILINMPLNYYIKIKNLLESLKNVISTNIIESYFKVDNKLTKCIFDIILTFYTPIKPIHII